MMKKILLGTGCVLLLLFGVFAAWHVFTASKGEPPALPSRMVKLIRVSTGGDDQTIVYPGRLVAKEHANLFFRVSGPVVENKLELGMAVKKDDVLMRIDPRDYEREVAKLTHELDVMKAKHVYLEQEYKRKERLLESNAVSRTVYEAALSAKDASGAEIQGKSTALQIAKDKLKDTRLIAPFNGRITRLDIEQFEMAKANEIVLSLQNLERLEVVVNIPEGNIPEFKSLGKGGLLGKEFPVFFPGRNLELNAALTEFSPVASLENGTYELRLLLRQGNNSAVFPGMTVEVRNLPGRGGTSGKKVQIPFSAVFRRDGKSLVWQYDEKNGRLSKKEIYSATPNGNMLETDSIPEGCFIVAAGGDWVAEDVPVSVMNPEVLHAHR